jgi:hypothetical protein
MSGPSSQYVLSLPKKVGAQDCHDYERLVKPGKTEALLLLAATKAKTLWEKSLGPGCWTSKMAGTSCAALLQLRV